MRLTSYNMAVKALNAKGCFANMVDRMWGYMEEGDTLNADCVRQKALMLLGLIKTIERWRPTITSGWEKTATATYVSGTFIVPNIMEEVFLNGMQVSSQGVMFDSNTNFVLKKYAKLINSFISSNDDVIQLCAKVSGGTIIVRGKNKSSNVFNLEYGFVFSSGATFLITEGDTIEINRAPRCLTNEQILSVIGKIDELCDNCNC